MENKIYLVSLKVLTAVEVEAESIEDAKKMAHAELDALLGASYHEAEIILIEEN